MQPPARFFSFDGIDGAGKSTQLRLFGQWLRELGYNVVECRDPGSTELGETLRSVLLDRKTLAIHRRCEMFVYMAARAQMVEEIIRPALQSGHVVVSDRYLLANVVYQGHAGGLDISIVKQIGEIATDGILPDKTFILDMDPVEAAGRIQRNTDRMEEQGHRYFQRVRQGFLVEAASSSDRISVIDASQPVEHVQDAVRAAAQSVLQDTI